MLRQSRSSSSRGTSRSILLSTSKQRNSSSTRRAASRLGISHFLAMRSNLLCLSSIRLRRHSNPALLELVASALPRVASMLPHPHSLQQLNQLVDYLPGSSVSHLPSTSMLRLLIRHAVSPVILVLAASLCPRSLVKVHQKYLATL